MSSPPNKTISPSKKGPGKRMSIDGVFKGVHVASSQPQTSDLDAEMKRLSLAGTFSRGWPGWRSVRGAGRRGSSIDIEYTLKMDGCYKHYVQISGKNASEEEEMEGEEERKIKGSFRLAEQMIAEIRTQSQSGESAKDLDEAIIDEMCLAVYGSNFIEQAGMLGLNETVELCRKVFRGENSKKGEEKLGLYEERDPAYAARIEKLVHNVKADGATEEGRMVLRSRREIIQHAVAFQHIINAVVKRDERISEELILQTHQILTDEISSASGISSAKYAGTYRRGDAYAGVTKFPKASQIAGAMRRFVKDLNRDIDFIEESKELDPFALAAKYCDRFVNIHPFADGNGRVCRLILNSLLMKYAGIIVPLGEKGGERDEYLRIASESSRVAGDPDQLSTMVLLKATAALKRLRNTLKRKSS